MAFWFLPFNNLKLTRCLTIWPALGQSWEDSPGGDQQPRQQMTGLRDNGDDKDKDNDQSLNHKKFSNVNHYYGIGDVGDDIVDYRKGVE